MANDTKLGSIISSTELTVSGYRVTGFGNVKTVFSRYMSPAYDDWRQYMSNYYLYLPFVGIIPIESEKYIGHTMSCKLFFDIRTGNLKYYIESDGVCLEQHEGSVKVEMPCTSASPFASAQSKIGGASEMLSGTIGTITNIASGNLSGTLQGVVSLGNNVRNIARPMQQGVNGGFSPSTAIHDSLHVYLMVETPEIIIDEALKSNYGMPCNIWSSIGSHKGYMEVDDIRLKGAIPPDDKAEILNALKNGIYVV